MRRSWDRAPRRLLTVLALAGCTVQPVSLDGRVCVTNADCISGYFCTGDLVCIPRDAGLDGGPPDAVRPDADRARDSAMRDAQLDADGIDADLLDADLLDAGLLDAGLDASLDAATPDAALPDVSTFDSGVAADANADAGIDLGL